MGQLDALIYKQWILTKRQRLSFGCQIITPLFSILMIWGILYIVKNTDLSSNDLVPNAERGSLDLNGVIPTYVYPGYLVNPQTSKYAKIFKITSPYRVIRYGLSDPGIIDDVEDSLYKNINFVDYVYRQEDYTMFNRSEYASIDAANKVLTKDIQNGMIVNRDLIEHDMTIPDAVLIFNKYGKNSGMDINMQVNNLMRNQYHRGNGITRLQIETSFGNSKSRTIKMNVPTEGFIGTMTYLNNKFINSIATDRELPTIVSLVSKTVDSTALYGYIDSGIASICATFVPLALSMGFPVMLFTLVLEKEERIMSLLQINGLSNRNYWVSLYVFYFGLLTATTSIFSILGWIFIDSTFFTVVNKFMLTIFFLGWNLSQIGFSIFISLMVDSSVYANLIGYLLSVLMTLSFSGISLMVFPSPARMPMYFYLIPQCSFVRWFYSIIFDCFSTKCPSGIFQMKGDTMRSFWGLMLSVPFYIVLCFVVANFKYILSLMGIRIKSKKTIIDTDYFKMTDFVRDSLVSSVHALSDISSESVELSDERYTIVSKNLRKVYDNGTVALKDFSLNIPKNKIFGLLGPNGAGKTTFLSILTGALEKSSGDVYFEGQEVIFGRRNDARIGFCPQFDILWPSLTVEEHIQFFTKFKDFKPDNMEEYVNSLIEAVDLDKDKKKRADELSGGMRRRVSLCNAVSGEPSVIFLDEPSSGLDPVRRREFWELIKKIGVGKAVVLTTHLMEEADVLSDEIGIMMNGEVKAVGTPHVLKEKYSSGMKLQVVVDDPSSKESVLSQLRSSFPFLEVTWEFDKTLTVTLGSGSDKFRPIFESVRRLSTAGLVTDWSIMEGSLEEVFLNVTRKEAVPRHDNTDSDADVRL